ncbi:MAG TPA: CBS domain-containing protein [Umezawaea sp.]|nr:CBS domain-containing protein [Umezawaea sp.]
MREPSVDQVMTRDVVTVRMATPFKELVELLDAKGFGALPVVDGENRPIGVVSGADLLAKEEFLGGTAPSPALLAGKARRDRWRKAHGVLASEVMTSPVVTVAPEASVSAAARQLARSGVRRLFVVDPTGALVGVVARRDLLGLFLRDDEELRADVLRHVLHGVLLADPATFEVAVEGGVVSVRGRLERRSETELAVRLIRAMPGVVDVVPGLTYGWDDSDLTVVKSLQPRF